MEGTIQTEATNAKMDKIRDCDLLIQNACVLTLDPNRTIYPNGAIAIDGRDIVAVGPSREIVPRFRGRRILDARGAAAHPGFIDTHVHLSHVNARGAFPDTLSFDEGMHFYTAWLNGLEDDDEYASAIHAALEMVRNGTTCFVEAGTAFEPDVIASAAEAAGIRALVADSWLWDVESYPGASKMHRRPVSRERSLRLLGGQLARNKDPHALVRGHVAIYGMGTASDELMLAAKDCADRNGTTFNQHQSFADADAAADDARLGQYPLVYYEKLGVLGPNCLFTHMNVIRDDEVAPILQSGMAVTWCLTSAMIWGVGGPFRGRHDEFHRKGVRVALGSDSGNSALRFDLTQQAVLAVLTARDKRIQRDALSPEDALEMLTISAARALKLERMLGSLEPGKRADLVIRTTNIPEAQPGLDEIQGIVLSQGSKSVDTVLIDGTIVVKGGHSTRLDEDLVYARLRESARRVISRIGMTAPSRWPRIL